MRIAQARLYRQLQPFIDGPYWCRGQTEVGFDSTIVALVAEDGTTGWGEAAPLGAFYSDGFPGGVRAGVKHLLPGIAGQQATAPTRLKERMDAVMWGQPMAKSAIDMAAWDLTARLAGLPLATLLGGAEGNGATLYRSVGQATPEEMAARAAGYVGAGYRHLHGGDPLEDAERLRAIRAQAGDAVPLWADANGAWNVDEAVRFAAATHDLDYRLEQPCMDHDANVQVSCHTGRPLVLDEAIKSVPDLLYAWHAAGRRRFADSTGRTRPRGYGGREFPRRVPCRFLLRFSAVSGSGQRFPAAWRFP